MGVGPGEAELMTLKAVRVIRQCPVVIIPAKDRQGCRAYCIARQQIPELDEKECIALGLPMTKDENELKKAHDMAAKKTARVLDEGKDAAFLTLGDPTVYATSMYIHERVSAMGYRTEIINGIPSFCAAAARLGTDLGSGDEQIHIIPAGYDMEETMGMPGTKILMKAGKQMSHVKEAVRSSDYRIMAVENCGTDGEKIYPDACDIPDEAGYYTVVIAKEKRTSE